MFYTLCPFAEKLIINDYTWCQLYPYAKEQKYQYNCSSNSLATELDQLGFINYRTLKRKYPISCWR